MAKVNSCYCYICDQLLTQDQAFDSQLFMDFNSNSSGRDIVKAVGDVELKYGACKFGPKSELLKFANPNIASTPIRGSRFEL